MPLGLFPDCLWVDPPYPPMNHEPGGRESAYHHLIGDEILRRIAAGQTIKAIAADPDMPSYATIFHWTKVIPEFGEDYALLRQQMAARKVAGKRAEIARTAARVAREKRLGLRRAWVSGQRSRYTPEWARAFCARVARGEAVSAIVQDPAMPSSKQVYTWLRKHPEFLDMYVAAKTMQAEWLAFQIDAEVMGARTPLELAFCKPRVAYLEERLGRLRAKTYRA